MKFARGVGILFGIAGLVLMLGTVGLCLGNLDAPVKILQMPVGAEQCSQTLMDAFAGGDYAAVEGLLYGQPDLGADAGLEDPVSVRVWQAFLDSVRYEFAGACYATDSGFARDATVTTLDLPALTADIQQRSHDLLTQRVEAATQMEELYDENNDFRQDLIDQVMEEAITQALAQPGQTVTYETTLLLVHRDGQWWVVPDRALLTALSGGMT